jgi:hypothetical protein
VDSEVRLGLFVQSSSIPLTDLLCDIAILLMVLALLILAAFLIRQGTSMSSHRPQPSPFQDRRMPGLRLPERLCRRPQGEFDLTCLKMAACRTSL